MDTQAFVVLTAWRCIAITYSFLMPNPIRQRAAKCKATALRLKYSAYYASFEKQEGSRVWMDGKEYVMLSSNDYLGLTYHPRVVEAGTKPWILGGEQYGCEVGQWFTHLPRGIGSETGEFLWDGRLPYHGLWLYGLHICHLWFCPAGGLVLADKNIHSSLWSGIALSSAKLERFSHNNPGSLGWKPVL